jgi:hypothetical protein
MQAFMKVFVQAVALYRLKTTITAVLNFPGTARRLDARHERAGASIAVRKGFSH